MPLRVRHSSANSLSVAGMSCNRSNEAADAAEHVYGVDCETRQELDARSLQTGVGPRLGAIVEYTTNPMVPEVIAIRRSKLTEVVVA